MFPVPTRRAGTITVAGELYEQLRTDILYARLRPGQRLRNEVLKQRYGGGVGTVREALNRLRAEGLVIQEDQRGFRVAPVSLDELRELTETRCWVNAVAVTASIANGDAAWEEGVLLAYHRMARHLADAAESEPRTQLRELHRVFHASLYAACGSRWLIGFSEALFDAAGRYQSLAYPDERDPRDYDAEHRAIMEAAIARKAPEAVALLDSHFRATAERVARAASHDNGLALT
jgi:GntR family transcriptional regulator, carbon starvation induced regulator